MLTLPSAATARTLIRYDPGVSGVNEYFQFTHRKGSVSPSSNVVQVLPLSSDISTAVMGTSYASAKPSNSMGCPTGKKVPFV